MISDSRRVQGRSPRSSQRPRAEMPCPFHAQPSVCGAHRLDSRVGAHDLRSTDHASAMAHLAEVAAASQVPPSCRPAGRRGRRRARFHALSSGALATAALDQHARAHPQGDQEAHAWSGSFRTGTPWCAWLRRCCRSRMTSGRDGSSLLQHRVDAPDQRAAQGEVRRRRNY